MELDIVNDQASAGSGGPGHLRSTDAELPRSLGEVLGQGGVDQAIHHRHLFLYLAAAAFWA